jgi:aspartyl-tRNA(Asn)/glutamyl-tRNA(Gln) amidotransferase subunit A
MTPLVILNSKLLQLRCQDPPSNEEGERGRFRIKSGMTWFGRFTSFMDIPLTISETQKGLSENKFSVVDLVDAYLARIKTFDKEINSFITVSDEIAYEQAKIADKRISELGEKAFEEFPLLGVVTAYKDLYLTKGIRTTAASKVLDSYIPQYSATVVERLEGAGAICIGKTNCDAWAHGGSGENSQFGATKNPWNK